MWYHLQLLQVSFKIAKCSITFVYNCTCFFIIVAWSYTGLGTAFAMIPQDYQWTLGLVCPIVRSICAKILQEIGFKASGSGSKGTRTARTIRISVNHFMETRHGIFLAIVLGGANQATVYCILGADFVINIYHGFKVIYEKNKNGAVSHGKLIYLMYLSIDIVWCDYPISL